MTEYDGPGRLLWYHLISKTRFPQPDFTTLALDRGHKYAATVSLRTIFVIELDNAAKGKRVIQAARTLLPNVRAFAGCAWCRNEETPHLLAAVLGTDVLVYDAVTLECVAHLQAPCGKSLHPPPIIDWGGAPSVFVSGGSGAQKMLKLWNVAVIDGKVEFMEAASASLPSVPQAFALHPTKPQLAVQAGPTVQVWSTKEMRVVFDKRFLAPVRSIAWSATRHSHLLLLYHRESGGRDSRFIGPVLADIDLTDQSCVEEPANLSAPHPLHNIASVRLHVLPLPFAPMLLVQTYSSQWSEGTYLRPSENPIPDGDTWSTCYEAQTSIVPSKGVRAVAVRRVDGDQDRSLQLLILYATGVLVLRAFMTKPMDLMLDTQIRLLQERKDVDLVKLSSGGTSLESIKLRVTVPPEQVPFLELTHHESRSPAVVFFELTVKTGDQEPELMLSNSCIRNDHELSLDDRLLDEIGAGMRQAILKAARDNQPWLPSMLDACHAHIQNMGMFQPSQLKKFLPSVAPNTPPRVQPPPTLVASFSECPFLPVQSPQVCYRRAYVVQPRYAGVVFSPTGQLVFYGHTAGTPDIHLLACPPLDDDPCRTWSMTGHPVKDCTANAATEDAPHVQGAWRMLAYALRQGATTAASRQVLHALLRSALASKRYLLFGAMAGVCVLGATGAALPLPEVLWLQACSCIRSLMTVALAKGHQRLETEAGVALYRLLGARALAPRTGDAFRLAFSHGPDAARALRQREMERDAAAADGTSAETPGSTPGASPGGCDRPRAGELLVLCGVCRSTVSGLAAACVRCGHVTHLTCQQRWFKQSMECPVGCGCVCEFSL